MDGFNALIWTGKCCENPRVQRPISLVPGIHRPVGAWKGPWQSTIVCSGLCTPGVRYLSSLTGRPQTYMMRSRESIQERFMNLKRFLNMLDAMRMSGAANMRNWMDWMTEKGNGNMRPDQIFMDGTQTTMRIRADEKGKLIWLQTQYVWKWVGLWVMMVRDKQDTNNKKKDVPAVSKFTSDKILIAHPVIVFIIW